MIMEVTEEEIGMNDDEVTEEEIGMNDNEVTEEENEMDDDEVREVEIAMNYDEVLQEDEGYICSSDDNDVISDDYTTSVEDSSEEGEIESDDEQGDVDVQDLAEEGKYLIFESSLMKLWNGCPKCGSAIVEK